MPRTASTSKNKENLPPETKECWCPKCTVGRLFKVVPKTTYYNHLRAWKKKLKAKGYNTFEIQRDTGTLPKTRLKAPGTPQKEDDINYFGSSQEDLHNPTAGDDVDMDDMEAGPSRQEEQDRFTREAEGSDGDDDIEMPGYAPNVHDTHWDGAVSDEDHGEDFPHDSGEEEGDCHGDDRSDDEQEIEGGDQEAADGEEEMEEPRDKDEIPSGAGNIGADDDELEEIDEEDPDLSENNYKSVLEDLSLTCEYIQAIKDATLDQDKLSPDVLQCLRNPDTTELDLSDPETRFAFKLLLSTTDGSQEHYNAIRDAHMDCFPDSHIMSYAQVKKKLTQISGVEPILYDMCPNSCMAYTGPQADLQSCPSCGHARYQANSGKPCQQFQTYPVGPMLQSIYRNPDNAKAMQYRVDRTHANLAHMKAEEEADRPGVPEVLQDVFDGMNYMEAVQKKKIKDDTITLMLSIDGAQLYRHKKSDFWIFVWVILDYPSNVRYRKDKVLIAAIVPGPEAPKDHNSFLFPSLYHLAAIQKEGLLVWDSSKKAVKKKCPCLFCTCADGPGIVHLNGCTGHKGYISCRLWCPMCGRRKPKAPRYYPMHSKPDNYSVKGCDHPDIDPGDLDRRTEADYRAAIDQLLSANNARSYARARMATGLSKPSILYSLPFRLPMPSLFAIDIMHLFCLNIPDLLISLFRGGSHTLKCDPKDDVSSWTWAVLRDDNIWQAYGKQVEAATPYLPGSFGRVPGNIAEKINSGYKACQHSLHLYGLAPALLLGVLSPDFHRHLCKKSEGISQDEVATSAVLGGQWVRGYESMYVQRMIERIHFCRPCIHTLAHCPAETLRFGPLGCMSQWTTERTIGNITAEVKQPSNPMANLTQRSLRRNQINTLIAMDPLLSRRRRNPYPKGSRQLRGGYVLLQKRERTKKQIADLQAREVIQKFLRMAPDETLKLRKWARLCLPNGQVARSLYKEYTMNPNKCRRARNVKFSCNGSSYCGEVQFYFRYMDDNIESAAALIAMFSDPYPNELEDSHGVVHICEYLGANGYIVVDVRAIKSVIAMVPFPDEHRDDLYYKVEKVGLDVDKMAGICYYDRN